MGASITAQKMEELDEQKLSNLKSSVIKDLKPEVKEIYDRRIAMSLITAVQMESVITIDKVLEFSELHLKDLKPEVQATYERRLASI